MNIKSFDSKKIFASLNQLLYLERKNSFKFEGVAIYPSEIHLILIIGRDSSSNATRMAELLGVTKGAISQTITRLEKKGILTKEKDPYNKNELTVTLTPLGIKAFDKYKQFQDSLMGSINELLSSFSKNEQNVIVLFCERLSEVITKLK